MDSFDNADIYHDADPLEDPFQRLRSKIPFESVSAICHMIQTPITEERFNDILESLIDMILYQELTTISQFRYDPFVIIYNPETDMITFYLEHDITNKVSPLLRNILRPMIGSRRRQDRRRRFEIRIGNYRIEKLYREKPRIYYLFMERSICYHDGETIEH